MCVRVLTVESLFLASPAGLTLYRWNVERHTPCVQTRGQIKAIMSRNHKHSYVLIILVSSSKETRTRTSLTNFAFCLFFVFSFSRGQARLHHPVLKQARTPYFVLVLLWTSILTSLGVRVGGDVVEPSDRLPDTVMGLGLGPVVVLDLGTLTLTLTVAMESVYLYGVLPIQYQHLLCQCTPGQVRATEG